VDKTTRAGRHDTKKDELNKDLAFQAACRLAQFVHNRPLSLRQPASRRIKQRRRCIRHVERADRAWHVEAR
jgi:hypothetical protein